MNTAPTAEIAEIEPQAAREVPWLASSVAIAVMIFGAALSVGVIVGLLGLPIALVGLFSTTITARTLVGRNNVGSRNLLTALLSYGAGLATSIACMAFASAASEGLVAESRGVLALRGGVIVHAILAHPLLWILGPILGAIALGITRYRCSASSALALTLWTVAPPITAGLVAWLSGHGWIALTA